MNNTRTKAVTLGFAFVVAILVANGALTYSNVRTIVECDRCADHTRAVIAELGNVLNNLVDAEMGKRDYFLMDEDESLEAYRTAIPRITRSVARLEALTADNPRQQVRITELRSLAATMGEALRQTLALREEKGLEVVRSGLGKRAMDRTRRVLADMQDEEDRILRLRMAGSRTAVDRTVASSAVGTALILALLLLAYRLKSYEEIESRRNSEAIRRSEQWFRTMADTAPVMIWVSGPEKVCTYFNKPWLDFTGRLVEQEVGDGWIAGVHHDDLGRCLDTYRSSFDARRPFTMEYRLRRHDGEYRWVTNNGVPWFGPDGAFLGFMGSCNDITEHKRAEQAARLLARASDTLASLVDEESTLQKVANLAVPDFADWCAVDLAGEDGVPRRLTVAHVDPAKVEYALELTRRYPTDSEGQTGVPRVLRTGASRLATEITDEMLVARARDPEHLRILRELGFRSYMSVPLKGRGGVLGAISFVAAESGRRFGPDDLRLAEDLGLRAAIAIENARLYDRLQEADRRKDEFLATLAHELRNPLAPIRNVLHLMKHPAEDRDGREAERAMAARQVTHMARLLDDLLDVSRISRGKIELRRERLELAPLVERAIESVRSALEERRHELTVALPAVPVYLEADPTRLEQVLWNLLHNAIKYTEPGGRIALNVERDDGAVVVRVRDSGIGIESEMLPHIFEMFVQVGRQSARAHGGLGIGLSLVKTLIEMHGGAISATSAGPGLGSEFSARLPVTTAPPRAGQATSPAPQLRTARPPRRRILIVDDNVDAATSLARLLSRLYGQETEVAHDGTAGLNTASRFLPEIILLDIGMPGMDGYEVARRLRERPEFARTLLVALTGWGQEADRRRSREAGFDHHLVKPVDPETLRELLAENASLCPG